MAFDINKFNEMMNQIMPYIMQDEMRKRYLREQIQGWTQYDKAKSEQEMKRQRELQELYLQNAAKETYLKKLAEVTGGEAAGQPMSSAYFVDAWNKYVPGTEMPGVPEDYPAQMEDFYNKVQQMIIAQKAQDPSLATDESIMGMMKGRGVPEVMEMMDKIMKGYTGTKEMDFAEKQLAEQAATRGVRERELEEMTKRRKAGETGAAGGATVGGADQKEAAKKLDALNKQRYSLIEDYLGIGGDAYGQREKSSKEALILNLNRQISSLKKQYGIITDDDRYLITVANELKKMGATKNDILTHPELRKRLESQGIIPIILLEYF